MGLAPDQVMAMSLHDYQAAIHWLNRDRAGEEEQTEALGEDEWDEMRVSMAQAGLH
jgi:hypothetical protein